MKECKHCRNEFMPRRTNHIYCTSSCKTKASYKRNNYRYISGHYQKLEAIPKLEGLSIPVKTDIFESIKILENKIDDLKKLPSINGGSVANAAMGSIAADATVFGLKKIFAPNSLPITKEDLNMLLQEIKLLQELIKKNNNSNPFQLKL